jgi:hypothetical protein
MRKSVIFTHDNLDLDACFAVLASIRYFFKESFTTFFKDPKWRDRIELVSADWDGKEFQDGDIAVDIEAGEKGKKGDIEEGERVDSATVQIVEEYAPIEDRQALQNIVYYINEHDATGSAAGSILGKEVLDRKSTIKILKCGSVDGMFRAAQAAIGYQDKKKIIEHFSLVFEGYLINGRKDMKAVELYPQRVKLHGRNKNIAFLDMKDAPFALCEVAFEKGAEIVIYKNGKDIGVKRRNFSKFPVNHPLILKLIKDAGEEGKWFIHPAGFLICTGSNKKHANFQTKVRIDQLIYTVLKALESYEFFFSKFNLSKPKKEQVVSVKKTSTKLIEA